MRQQILFFICLLTTISGISQNNGIIRGRITNSISNEPVPFANLTVDGTTLGSSTDIDGYFEIKGVEPGFRNLNISCLGFKPIIYRDVMVTNAIPAVVQIKMEEESLELKEVSIQADPFNKTSESPISLRTIGIAEIERNPGGNRDISSVIRSFPGVTSTPAFRNDIIIRGGSPGENRFYLDGIEVPVINHFQTQGASGGPVGLINVNLIREVDFLSGAFPSNRGNALSSVLEFKQVDGNNEKWRFRAAIGSSDAGIKADGPIGKKSTLIVSARASYLQLLFTALKLPFLPTYYDWQFKYKIKFNEKHELIFIGLGGIDRSKLNLDANETPSQRYILNFLPVNNQLNYTLGGVYKYYTAHSSHMVVLSRNFLDNNIYKYQNNDESSSGKKILDYRSQESENKLRYEFTWRKSGWKVNAGINAEHARYYNSTYNRINTPLGIDTIEFNTTLHLFNGGIFAQASKKFFKEKLSISAGLRFDNSSFNTYMANPLNQFSPRVSISYQFIKSFAINFNIGRYFQRPAYTLLGYRNQNGELENADRMKYIRSDHIVAGLEWTPTPNTKITAEGFVKFYAQYPFSLRDSINIANAGADYGVVGNVPADSRADGRAYGFEFLAQQKLWKGFYGILAYTFVRSEFEDKNGNYVPSSWDSRHIITLTAGYKFKYNWEIGARWRFVDGQPFTPYDIATSSIKAVWDITGRGIEDISRLNTERIDAFHQLDIRLDKSWYFKKWSLNLYLDVQNVYNFKAVGRPYLTTSLDKQGNPIDNPTDPSRYLTQMLENKTGTVLPSIGIIVDF
ncbi:MAG: TonB-dependent receptor [Candidatus Competibacteraceae bacterium]|nr:TonB-dependent receptor [Candidatus Competibacteraceae bacterium]